MKTFVITLSLCAVGTNILYARELKHVVEGEAPIEVVAPAPLVVDEVKEYEYDNSPNKEVVQFQPIPVEEQGAIKKGLDLISNKEEMTSLEAPAQQAQTDQLQVELRTSERSFKKIDQAEFSESYYPFKKGDTSFAYSFAYGDSHLADYDERVTSTFFRSEFAFTKTLSARNAVSASVSYFHQEDSELVVENVSMTVMKLNYTRFMYLTHSFFAYGSIGVAFTDYNLRLRVFENDNLITYKKLSAGFAVGTNYELGLRFYLGNDMSLDLGGEYTHYMGDDSKPLSNIAIRPKFNLTF